MLSIVYVIQICDNLSKRDRSSLLSNFKKQRFLLGRVAKKKMTVVDIDALVNSVTCVIGWWGWWEFNQEKLQNHD